MTDRIGDPKKKIFLRNDCIVILRIDVLIKGKKGNETTVVLRKRWCRVGNPSALDGLRRVVFYFFFFRNFGNENRNYNDQQNEDSDWRGGTVFVSVNGECIGTQGKGK